MTTPVESAAVPFLKVGDVYYTETTPPWVIVANYEDQVMIMQGEFLHSVKEIPKKWEFYKHVDKGIILDIEVAEKLFATQQCLTDFVPVHTCKAVENEYNLDNGSLRLAIPSLSDELDRLVTDIVINILGLREFDQVGYLIKMAPHGVSIRVNVEGHRIPAGERLKQVLKNKRVVCDEYQQGEILRTNQIVEVSAWSHGTNVMVCADSLKYACTIAVRHLLTHELTQLLTPPTPVSTSTV